MRLRTGRRTSKVKTSESQGIRGTNLERRRKLRSGLSSGYDLDDDDAEEKEDDDVWHQPMEGEDSGCRPETSMFEEKGQPVFDLDLGSPSDSQESSDDDDEEDDEDVMANLPDHLSRAVRGENDDVESSGEDGDEEESGAKNGYSGTTWGRRKVAYYDADTADLEIGQDFEDAEEEELAVLEAQRAEAKQLDEADLWDMEDGNDVEGNVEIANGGSSRAAQNYNKSGLQRLDLMMNESPELHGLLARLKSSLSQLVGTIDPLCRVVTEDIGTSEDGLQYLMSGGASDVRGHPIMLRLLQLKKISDSLEPIDSTLSAQVELLKDALESGINFNQKEDNDDEEDEVQSAAVYNAASEQLDNVDRKGKEDRDGITDDSESGEELRIPKGGYDSSAAAAAVAVAANAEMDKEENDFLDRGVENGMRNNHTTQKRKIEVRRMQRHHRVGDFGDDDAAYEAYRKEHLVGVVNPVQAAANRAMQKTRLGPRSRLITGDDNEMEYAAKQRQYGQQQPPLHHDGDWQHDASSGEEEVDYEEREAQDHGNNMNGFDSDSAEYLENTLANKAAYKAQKLAKYNPGPRIAGTLQEELDADMKAFYESKGHIHKRAASYTIIKNRGLIPHKNKANRNPRVKKRLAYRKAVIRRKGQVRDMRHPSEAATYGGEATGIRTRITRGRKL